MNSIKEFNHLIITKICINVAFYLISGNVNLCWQGLLVRESLCVGSWFIHYSSKSLVWL